MDIATALDFSIALLTLTVLEVVLGIDNLVFLTVITSRLPEHQQKAARRVGLILACLMRLALLAALSWLLHLTIPLFTVFQQTFSIRDLILLVGGLFLLIKGTEEIHTTIEGLEKKSAPPLKKSTFLFSYVILQIVLLDAIFSLDSVLTAIGMTQEFLVMALAIIIAVILMIFASEPLSRFIKKYRTVKMLALSFLLLVGIVLIADGFKFHIPRGYIYFAIAFSIFVEAINITARKKRRKHRHHT
jgi:predicted tellurium resistance membrane protein TerC